MSFYNKNIKAAQNVDLQSFVNNNNNIGSYAIIYKPKVNLENSKKYPRKNSSCDKNVRLNNSYQSSKPDLNTQESKEI